MAEVIVKRAGASKPNPFTICIVGNPAMETPWKSGVFQQDLIMNAKPAFASAATYIEQCLFGLVPGISEQFLVAPGIASQVRLITIWDATVPVTDANALVGLDGVSNILVARRNQMKTFVNGYSVNGAAVEADIIYAISSSSSHNRASAWFTTDDNNRPGVAFTLDGVALSHRFYSQIPGTIALHSSVADITPLHEFQHAISSYQNGSITDLYVDSPPAVNCKVGRPIPASFCVYDGSNYATDPSRDSLGYPASWQSYHCELFDPRYPAVMDNYYQAAGGNPLVCQNDKITRRFAVDRIMAKLSR